MRAWIVPLIAIAASADADVTTPPRSVAAEPVAYVASDETGLLRIEPSGRRGRIGPFKIPRGVVVLGDAPASLFVLDGMSVWRSGLRGENAARISSIVRDGVAWFLGGTRGALWSVNQRDVHVWRDGSWTEQLFPDAPNSLGMFRFTVDMAGAAWIANEHGIWRSDGKTWNAVPPPLPLAALKYCSLDGGRAILLGCWDAVWRWESGAWRKLATIPREVVEHAALASDGTLVVATLFAGMRARLRVFSSGGDQLRLVERESPRTNALVVDGRGRTWIATDRGVDIVDRDGREVAPRWLRDAGRVRDLLVVGDGPKF